MSRVNGFQSMTLSLSGSYRDLNKEILSQIGLASRKKALWNITLSKTLRPKLEISESCADAGIGIVLDEEQSMWTVIKALFGYSPSYDLQEHWSFSKLHIVAVLRSSPEDYLCSVRHTLTGHMAICRVLRRKIARPHKRVFEMEKKCWHKVSFCGQVLTCRVYYKTHNLDVFICEYFHGSLLSELLAEGVIQPRIITKIISQVAFAICSMHNQGMIFRGVATQSILVDADGNIRLFDFQFAINKEWSFYPAGFLPYMAPEMVEGRKAYGPEVDYWSLGILMYELIVRHSPLSIFCWMVGLRDVRDPEYSMLLLAHMPIRLPTNIDPNAKALMLELLHDNPSLRIGCRRRGFDELRNHPYFDNVVWESYLDFARAEKSNVQKVSNETFHSALIPIGRTVSSIARLCGLREEKTRKRFAQNLSRVKD